MIRHPFQVSINLAGDDLYRLTGALNALLRAANRLEDEAMKAMTGSTAYTGTPAFAPIVSAAIASDLLAEGCRAQVKSTLDRVATSTQWLAATIEQEPKI